MEKNIVPDAVPGQVVAADADGIAVVTGDGLLVMEEIQLEGKKRMPVADFLRGRDIPAGTILGEQQSMTQA